MDYVNLSDDPDWGHKPEDDDFVFDDSDMRYMDDTIISLIERTNRNIAYDKHFERGYNYYESKFYREALDEFLAGHKETGCPKCSTMVGIIIADKLWNDSKSIVPSYIISSIGDNPVPYLQKGMSANLPEAMVALAMVYAKPGRYQNENKVSALMEKAAKLGHPLAIKALEEYRKSRPGIFKSLKFGFSKATLESISEIICDSAGGIVENTLKRLFFR